MKKIFLILLKLDEGILKNGFKLAIVNFGLLWLFPFILILFILLSLVKYFILIMIIEQFIGTNASILFFNGIVYSIFGIYAFIFLLTWKQFSEKLPITSLKNRIYVGLIGCLPFFVIQYIYVKNLKHVFFTWTVQNSTSSISGLGAFFALLASVFCSFVLSQKFNKSN